MSNGFVVSFEGGDGSGKGTQSRLYFEHLQNLDVPVRFDSFPRYETPTGKKVAAYLNGELGENVDPRVAAELYSNDRLAARDEMLDWIEAGGSWVLDRYVDSNKGHQGGKFATREERAAYFKESDALEFGINGMPIPKKTILLPMPAALAQTYVDQKMARKYTDKKRDLHEADPAHLQNANEAFLQFAELNPDRVIVIDPVSETRLAMRPIEDIQRDIQAALRPLLI